MMYAVSPKVTNATKIVCTEGSIAHALTHRHKNIRKHNQCKESNNQNSFDALRSGLFHLVFFSLSVIQSYIKKDSRFGCIPMSYTFRV